MLERLPKPVEIALFVVLALICATVVAASPKKDSALFFASVPLFLICALLGNRRTQSRIAAEIDLESDTSDEQVG